jgi:hypothetical protein
LDIRRGKQPAAGGEILANNFTGYHGQEKKNQTTPICSDLPFASEWKKRVFPRKKGNDDDL